MDVSLNSAGNAMAALVVRQFAPSRIERQLLAQVFDLVCDQRCDVGQSRSIGRSAAPTHRVGDGRQGFVAHVAGRRAA
jgi:hypothetical protein